MNFLTCKLLIEQELKIFINDNGFAKVQICIAKGKRNYDKRETIKKREAKVKISRILKRN